MSHGVRIATALTPVLPPLGAQLLAVGEETGRLPELARQVADTYDRELKRALRSAVALIEPALILFFAVLVGFVALAMLQAIYSVNAGSAVASNITSVAELCMTINAAAKVRLYPPRAGRRHHRARAARRASSRRRSSGVCRRRRARRRARRSSCCRVALDGYRLDNGSYPTTDQGLAALRERPTRSPVPSNWRGPYLRKAVPLDPWGRPYLYRAPGERNPGAFDLESLGRDGKVGGDGRGCRRSVMHRLEKCVTTVEE